MRCLPSRAARCEWPHTPGPRRAGSPLRPPARRRRRCASEGSWLAQRIADAADRVDQIAGAGLLQLAAQVADIDAQRVRGGAEVVSPNALVDDAVREHAARVEHQKLEQLVLRARELDEVLADDDAVTVRVEAQLGERQGTRI